MFYNSWNPKLTTNSCCLCARRFVWGARMCAWALSLWAHVDPRDGRQKPQAVTAPFASASEPKRRPRGCDPARLVSYSNVLLPVLSRLSRAARRALCSALLCHPYIVFNRPVSIDRRSSSLSTFTSHQTPLCLNSSIIVHIITHLFCNNLYQCCTMKCIHLRYRHLTLQLQLCRSWIR